MVSYLLYYHDLLPISHPAIVCVFILCRLLKAYTAKEKKRYKNMFADFSSESPSSTMVGGAVDQSEGGKEEQEQEQEGKESHESKLQRVIEKRV